MRASPSLGGGGGGGGGGRRDVGVYVVLDGHGGSKASEYAAEVSE